MVKKAVKIVARNGCLEENRTSRELRSPVVRKSKLMYYLRENFTRENIQDSQFCVELKALFVKFCPQMFHTS